ncbi:NAD(P)H nitroreductase [Nocardia panacis]|nr:NAD(P)H nitroreductase [Nocardia panacis]
MTGAFPQRRALTAALDLAVRAPSVYHRPPWRWRVDSRAVRLHLDPTCMHRDAVIGCGAAMHHLRISLAALGWSTIVDRFPTPADPTHLASLEPVPHRPTGSELALHGAISRRGGDDRFGSRPLPPGYLGLVSERAATLGATVHRPADAARDRLVAAIELAAHHHSIPTPSNRPGGLPRDIERTPAIENHHATTDSTELLILGTRTDDPRAHLDAGEALSAVLLTATNIGLDTRILTEPMAHEALRTEIRTHVLGRRDHPQAIIRIGRPTAVAALDCQGTSVTDPGTTAAPRGRYAPYAEPMARNGIPR